MTTCPPCSSPSPRSYACKRPSPAVVSLTIRVRPLSAPGHRRKAGGQTMPVRPDYPKPGKTSRGHFGASSPAGERRAGVPITSSDPTAFWAGSLSPYKLRRSGCLVRELFSDAPGLPVLFDHPKRGACPYHCFHIRGYVIGRNRESVRFLAHHRPIGRREPEALIALRPPALASKSRDRFTAAAPFHVLFIGIPRPGFVIRDPLLARSGPRRFLHGAGNLMGIGDPAPATPPAPPFSSAPAPSGNWRSRRRTRRSRRPRRGRSRSS